MGDDLFASRRRGPGHSEASRATEWPQWVKDAQAQDNIAKEIEGMFVPVSLRAISQESELKMALPLPISFDRAAADIFFNTEMGWGERGVDFIRRFMPQDFSAAEFTVVELYDRIVEERRYDDSPLISSFDLNAALDRATSIGLLEVAHRGDRVDSERIYRLSGHQREINELARSFDES